MCGGGGVGVVVPSWFSGKEYANTGDVGLISGSGRPAGGGNGNLL